MSANSAYFDIAERDSVAQVRKDLEDRVRNSLYLWGSADQRGIPQSHVDNIDPAVRTFNRINTNIGLGLGKKKNINAV